MIVQDTINYLQNGMFKPLNIGVNIDVNIPVVVGYINKALKAIYTRFPILYNDYIIDLKDNITDYTLPDNLIAIFAIYDEDGNEFEFNNPNNRFSILQSSYNTIQVPNPSTGASISVIYQACPTELSYDISTEENKSNTLNQIIPIPNSLYDALIYYMANEAYLSVSNKEDFNNKFYTLYKEECAYVESLGKVPKYIPNILTVSLHEGISEILPMYE